MTARHYKRNSRIKAPHIRPDKLTQPDVNPVSEPVGLLEITDKQVLGLIPASAIIDFDGAKKALLAVAKAQHAKTSAYYQQRVVGLEAEIADYKAQATLTYCVYCGATFPLDNEAGEKVTKHIETCEKHPLFIAKQEIEKLKADLRSLMEQHSLNVDFANTAVANNKHLESQLSSSENKVRKQVAKEIIEEIETLFFAEPQLIAECGREPVLGCIDGIDWQALKSKHSV